MINTLCWLAINRVGVEKERCIALRKKVVENTKQALSFTKELSIGTE
jgi:hypothetical protein